MIVVLSHSSRDGMHFLPGIDVEGTGRLGVWMFFTLSAFLLTRQLVASGAPLNPRIAGGYLLRRIFRIYPMFVVALLIDYALGRLSGSRVTDALLLVYGPDIFWTVPVEFQYYFAIPFVAAALLRRSLAGGAVLAAIVFALSLSVPLARPVSWIYVTIFIVGSFAAVAADRVPPRLVSRIALACLIPTVLVVPSVMRLVGLDQLVDPQVPRNTHAVFGVLFVPIVLAAFSCPGWRRILGWAPLVAAGKISFSLYLLHPLALVAVAAAPIPLWSKGPAVMLVSLAAAALAYLVVERPARRLGYALTGRWGKMPHRAGVLPAWGSRSNGGRPRSRP